MIYHIKIEKLTFYAIIGILPFERQTPQRVVVDIELSYQGEYVDYAKVAKLIQSHIKEQKFYLLEDALSSCAQLLQKNFPQLRTIAITITKPQILPNATPSVSISLNLF